MASFDNPGEVATWSDTALTAMLADAISEALVLPPNAQGRAAAISSLIREIYETVQWVAGMDTDSAELRSLRSVASAAADHEARMGGSVDTVRLSA